MIAHPEKRIYLQNTESVQFFIIMSVLISFYSVCISARFVSGGKIADGVVDAVRTDAVAVSSAISR